MVCARAARAKRCVTRSSNGTRRRRSASWVYRRCTSRRVSPTQSSRGSASTLPASLPRRARCSPADEQSAAASAVERILSGRVIGGVDPLTYDRDGFEDHLLDAFANCHAVHRATLPAPTHGTVNLFAIEPD